MRAMMALIEHEKCKHIRVEHIQKLAWGKFPFRVEFDAFNYTKQRLPKSQTFRHTFIHNDVLSDIVPKGEYRARNQMLTTSLYFSKEEDVLAALRILEGYVSLVAMPRNEKDLAILLIGDDTCVKTVIRPNLFWARYRYAVSFRDIDATSELKEIEQWLATFNEFNTEEERILFSYSGTRRAYFLDEDDLLYFKLVFHSAIRRYEKALLYSEIDNEPRIAESVD